MFYNYGLDVDIIVDGHYLTCLPQAAAKYSEPTASV